MIPQERSISRDQPSLGLESLIQAERAANAAPPADEQVRAYIAFEPIPNDESVGCCQCIPTGCSNTTADTDPAARCVRHHTILSILSVSGNPKMG